MLLITPVFVAGKATPHRQHEAKKPQGVNVASIDYAFVESKRADRSVEEESDEEYEGTGRGSRFNRRRGRENPPEEKIELN